MDPGNAGNRGRLIAFEGPDGVGKTTLHEHALSFLLERSIPTLGMAFPGKDPETLGGLIYRAHHGETTPPIGAIDPLALQLAHIAAHVDAIRRPIRSALAEGRIVVLDRYWWSTWAYGIVNGIDRPLLEAAIDLEIRVWGDLTPDLVILVAANRPFRPENEQHRHAELSSRYDELAASAEHPIARLVNDSSLPAAKAAVEDLMLKHIVDMP